MTPGPHFHGDPQFFWCLENLDKGIGGLRTTMRRRAGIAPYTNYIQL